MAKERFEDLMAAHGPKQFSEPDFGPLGKPPDNEIDVESPSVIYLPDKNCYFNGFQEVDSVRGFMLDSSQGIIFRGTEYGMASRNAVYELLRSHGHNSLIVELNIPNT